jgi:ribose 5-phosphate isomerase B
MRIHIATDHAGLEFSTRLQHHLAAQGHEVVDHGPIDYDPVDDYPAFCIRAAQSVVDDRRAGVEALGIVFG